MDRPGSRCVRCMAIIPDMRPFTICDECWDTTHIPTDKEPVFTQADLDHAVEAEREACANICDDTTNNWRGAAKEHAKLIRARGSKT